MSRILAQLLRGSFSLLAPRFLGRHERLRQPQGRELKSLQRIEDYSSLRLSARFGVGDVTLF